MTTHHATLVPDIPSLDGLRAVSVLIVMVSHAGLGHVVPGGLGVTVFFFLSGYLITTLLRAEWARTGTVGIGAFYIRRFLRLGPPLFITLAVAYGLVAAGLHGGGVSVQGALAQVFYMANYYAIFWDPGQTVPDGTGVLWSLAVEEHFYLLYPFVFLLLARRLTARQLAAVLVGVCLAVLAWRVVLVAQPGVLEARTYYATDTRIDSIAWGAVLALAFNPVRVPGEPVAALPLPTRPDWRHALALAAGLGLLLFTLVVRDPWMRETLRYTLQGVALMPVFYVAIRFAQHPLFRPLNWAWVRRLGVYSYAMYLIHHVVVLNLKHHMPWGDRLLPVLAVTLVVSVLYAAAIEHWVESRMRRLRARFRPSA